MERRIKCEGVSELPQCSLVLIKITSKFRTKMKNVIDGGEFLLSFRLHEGHFSSFSHFFIGVAFCYIRIFFYPKNFTFA